MTASVDGSIKYQTMDGLGAAINVHSWNNGALKPALDMLIDGNGTKIFRVVMEMTDWETTNDASNSNTYNWNYYNPIYSGATSYDTAESGSNFSDLWNVIDYLHLKHVPDSQIALSFMGIGPSWMGTLTPDSRGGTKYVLTPGNENEWAEMIASAAYYGYSHGHTFGIISPDNEVDWSYHEGITMTPSQWALAMNDLNTKLNALGGMSSVRFLGPESSGSNPISTEDALAAYPAAMARLDDFDGHNYGPANPAGPTQAATYGKGFWTSEFSDVQGYGIDHLNAGSTGLIMWDGYDAIYNHAELNNYGNLPGNDKGPQGALIQYVTASKTYVPRKSFYQFGQLSKYTEPGTRRVSTISSNSAMQLVSFIHPTDNSLTIVGQNTTSSTQVIGGTLKNAPANSVLHYSQTTTTDNMKAGADVIVTNGTFKVSIPAGAMFTLTTLPL